MGLSLPGNLLFYLSKDNLAPEAYERIISPFFAWSAICRQYVFGEGQRGVRHIIDMRERSHHYLNPDQARPHGLGEQLRLKNLLSAGEVVMLSDIAGPASLFYINDTGQLICTAPHVFRCYGANNILREYAHSVSRRDYSPTGGQPRPTPFRVRRRSSEAEKEILPPPAPAKTRREPEQQAQSAKKKREITLTIGVFFDGTGNNAVNVDNMLQACTTEHFNLSAADARLVLDRCGQEQIGVSGIGASSYTGYFTNVHWLNTLYKQVFPQESEYFQRAVYIEGIGTKAGKPDSTVGQALGISDTGVIAKTDDAVSKLPLGIQQAIVTVTEALGNTPFVIKALQFDIFGFSRGATAARHFANRVSMEEAAIIAAIRAGIGEIEYRGAPAGKNRFIGIFDSVAAIGTPINGFNPHSADTGSVNILLRPGVAERVFHITAQHECRFNFALNSVQPGWPELALPGAHSDIGGGYLPLEQENLYLTRPRVETVPLTQPGEQTRVYRQAMAELKMLDAAPAIAPIVRQNTIMAETWSDDRLPPNHYGNFQKRSFAALSIRDRRVKNDWSKVVLQVMLDAAQEAGVLFDAIDPKNPNMKLPTELIPLCDKAIAMGKAARRGQPAARFTASEIDLLAKDFIHCSANWNAITLDAKGMIRGGTSPAAVISFTNRPDEQWRRTVYNMDGKKQ
jgi:Uncharacterized alpha/beta hydrolase domain (DUF2235)